MREEKWSERPEPRSDANSHIILILFVVGTKKMHLVRSTTCSWQRPQRLDNKSAPCCKSCRCTTPRKTVGDRFHTLDHNESPRQTQRIESRCHEVISCVHLFIHVHFPSVFFFKGGFGPSVGSCGSCDEPVLFSRVFFFFSRPCFARGVLVFMSSLRSNPATQ